MSHRPVWLCVSCHYQLGEVIHGALALWASGAMIGKDATSVICPRCGHVCIWKHAVTTPAR